MNAHSEPDFSALRSTADRADAEHGYESGMEIAERLLAVTAFLRRLAAPLWHNRERARVTWDS